MVASTTAALVIASCVAYMAGGTRVDAAELCPAPPIAPGAAWSPALAAKFAARTAAVFGENAQKWASARAQACRAAPAARMRQLACPDGVLVRLAAVRRAA